MDVRKFRKYKGKKRRRRLKAQKKINIKKTKAKKPQNSTLSLGYRTMKEENKRNKSYARQGPSWKAGRSRSVEISKV